MQAAPPVDGFVDDGDINEADDAKDSGGSGAGRGATHVIAQHEVADVDKPEDERRGKFGVPGPPCAPGSAAPDGAGYESQGGEEGPKFSGRACCVVPTFVFFPEIDDADDGEYARGEHGYPGDGDVEVEDALWLALNGVGWGIEE